MPGGHRRHLIAATVLLALVVPMASSAPAEKVVVIGLDGASHEYMQQCMEERDVPNIEAVASDGSFSRMDAPLPPLTPVAMSSFLTGQDPGGHGIYGFEKRKPLEYDTSMVNGQYLSGILPDATEGKSVLINVPMTYPAPQIDGVVVSGFPGSNAGRYAYPPPVKSRLEDMNYTVTTAGTFDTTEELEEGVFDAFEQRRGLALDFMDRYEWNLFMVMFTGDARILHFESPEGCDGAIGDYYEEVDAFLGQVRERTPDNTTVVLMSNHGFAPLDKKLYLYTFLKDQGYLEPKTVPYYKHMLQDFLGDVAEFLGLGSGGEIAGRASGFSSAYMDEIDWSGTEAYTGAFYNGQIFINLEGREPHGTVPQDRYEEVRSDIIEDLKALRDPETGERVVENVYTKEELYDGEKMDELPDIIVEMPGYNHIARFGFGSTFLRDPVEKSAPVKEGFLLTNRDVTAGNISIVDLSTSVADLLGAEFGEGDAIWEDPKDE